MKKSYLIWIVVIILAWVLFFYLKDGWSNDSILASVCKGSLEKIKNENPAYFLELYEKAKTETNGVLSGNCKSGEDLADCIDRLDIYLEHMNCMAKFLNQSNLSEKEIKEIRDLAEIS